MTNQMDQEVEEARAKLALWTYPYTGIDPLGFAHDMDALIEAVRRQERERAGREIRYHLQEWHSYGRVRCTECGQIIDRFGVCAMSCEIGLWRRGWRARSSEEAGNG